jgi:hypothetical protein
MYAEGWPQTGHIGSTGIVNLVGIQPVQFFLLNEASLVPIPLFCQVLATAIPHFLYVLGVALLTFGLLRPEIEDLCISNVH